jgi:hypothetical protein
MQLSVTTNVILQVLVNASQLIIVAAIAAIAAIAANIVASGSASSSNKRGLEILGCRGVVNGVDAFTALCHVCCDSSGG